MNNCRDAVYETLGLGSLTEARFDDREIIIELIRAAEAPDVLDELIHHRFVALIQGSEIADAGRQIPGRLPVIKDLKDTVAKDEQAGAKRDIAGVRRKLRAAHDSHHRTGGG